MSWLHSVSDNGSLRQTGIAWPLKAGPPINRLQLLRRLRVVLVILPLFAGVALADNQTDVPSAYRETAHLYGIPPVLFYAVALQESGRTVRNLYRPWPWTLNVEGEPYYYDSQTELWDALREFVMAGRTNIGIGLLQVTYPYNRHVLSDVYAATDPNRNLQMGALILVERYRETGDWWIAVGHYHSPGKGLAQIERAHRYRESVRRRWRKLYGTLADELPQGEPIWASVDTP